MELITLNIDGRTFYHNAVWLFANCNFRWRILNMKPGFYAYVSRSSRRILEDIVENAESYLIDDGPAPCTYAFLRKEDAMLFKLSCC